MTLQEFFWNFGYYANPTDIPYNRDWIDCVGLNDFETVQRKIRMVAKAQQLYDDVMNCFGDPNNQELQIIKKCIEASMIKRKAKVDDICKVLNAMGFETWEQLESWISIQNYLNFDFAGAIEVMRPSCPDLGELQLVPLNTVRTYIRRACPIINPFEIDNDDREYKLVPYGKVQEINDTCPAHRAAYLPDENDCDDFTRVQLGWLSENGYGNLAWGAMTCSIEYKNDLPGSLHRLCCCVTDNAKLIIIEPQRSGPDAIYEYTGPESVPFPNVKKLIPVGIRM